MQYPHIKPVSENAKRHAPRWPFWWRYQMSIMSRLSILMLSLFCIVVFGALLSVMLLMVGAVLFG